MWSQHMRFCKSLQISSAGSFPRLDEKRRHRTGEVNGKARVAKLDADGVRSAPVGIAHPVADGAQALNN